MDSGLSRSFPPPEATRLRPSPCCLPPSVSSAVCRYRCTGLTRSSAMPARPGTWSAQCSAVLAFSAPQAGQACRSQNCPSSLAGKLQAPFAEDRPHTIVAGGDLGAPLGSGLMTRVATFVLGGVSSCSKASRARFASSWYLWRFSRCCSAERLLVPLDTDLRSDAKCSVLEPAAAAVDAAVGVVAPVGVAGADKGLLRNWFPSTGWTSPGGGPLGSVTG
mmetsp:Transcript_66846/g.118621  ORF Transcript_66846/g.118621 Transcript_66846/m.118621 type:complete len:219 (+) Transcript_66846:270-926(+)